MVAGDDQAPAGGHDVHHVPERIGSQVLGGFVAELLKSVAGDGQVVDAIVGPTMPEHQGWRGFNPVETGGPFSVEAFRPGAGQVVGEAGAVVVEGGALANNGAGFA